MPEPTQITERLDRLEDENRHLRLDLDLLRASISAEVRTRRLVVVADDGFERIVAEADHAEAGSLALHVRPAPNDGTGAVERTSVRLFANEEWDGAGVLLDGPGSDGRSGGAMWSVARVGGDRGTSFHGADDLDARITRIEDWNVDQEDVLSQIYTVLTGISAVTSVVRDNTEEVPA